MDLSYILFNTIVYGVLATTLAAFMAYWKFLNLAVAAYFVLSSYVVYQLVTFWFGRGFVAISLLLVWVFFCLHQLLLKLFKNEKQRDLAAIVITLSAAYFLDNIIAYFYGPWSINVQNVQIGIGTLIAIFVLLLLVFYYVFSKSTIWVVLKWIYEKTAVIKSLWVRVDRLLQIVFGMFLILLLATSFLYLTKSAIRPTDGIFFLLKAVGIMIMVWVDKKEYMFVGSLLYVIVEYILFIERWLPIVYKETLILFVILAVLLIKPEGLFSLAKRKT